MENEQQGESLKEKSLLRLTLWERRARSGKRIMVSCDSMRDIALFRPSVTSGPGQKKDRENDHSQSGAGYKTQSKR